MIDSFATIFVSHQDQKLDREDHVHLYNLLGDPALRIRRPCVTATVTAPKAAAWGARVPVRCTLSRALTGTAVVTIEAKRGEVINELAPLMLPPLEITPLATTKGKNVLNVIRDNWTKASRSVVARTTTSVAGKDFSADLQLPSPGHPPGDYHVKIYVTGKDGAAMGSATIALRTP